VRFEESLPNSVPEPSLTARRRSREGVVKNITDFGASLVSGVSNGCCMSTDMSWPPRLHPSQGADVGDTVSW